MPSCCPTNARCRARFLSQPCESPLFPADNWLDCSTSTSTSLQHRLQLRLRLRLRLRLNFASTSPSTSPLASQVVCPSTFPLTLSDSSLFKLSSSSSDPALLVRQVSPPPPLYSPAEPLLLFSPLAFLLSAPFLPRQCDSRHFTSSSLQSRSSSSFLKLKPRLLCSAW